MIKKVKILDFFTCLDYIYLLFFKKRGSDELLSPLYLLFKLYRPDNNKNILIFRVIQEKEKTEKDVMYTSLSYRNKLERLFLKERSLLKSDQEGKISIPPRIMKKSSWVYAKQKNENFHLNNKRSFLL